MPQHATTTGPATRADSFTTLLDILHHAVSQDGTFETARESLRTIEDLAMAAVGTSHCPDMDGE